MKMKKKIVSERFLNNYWLVRKKFLIKLVRKKSYEYKKH